MNMDELFNKLLLLRTPGVGPAKYNALVKKFGGADDVVTAVGVDGAVRDSVMRELDAAQKLGIHYICDTDDCYPIMLRALKNHPPVLSVRGNIDALCRPMVGIVGTRHATAAGMRIAGDIAQKFAEHGNVVVSGMAMGTDTAAHRGALQVGGNAQTVAVLAGGVDVIWPLENESLYWEIVARGAVISEMPVGVAPLAQHFVIRNRWIAGMAEKLILGEADLKSGSMTTARFAIEAGREIWAIPSHPLDSRAAGPNSLIKTGAAKLCSGASDFFVAEKNSYQMQKNEKKFADENSVLDALGTIPVSETVLSEIAKKTVSEIKAELVVLELQGLVRKVDGGYVRA